MSVFMDILLISEIRRSPVEVGSLSHYLQGFYTSQAVQDFFHQQYVVVELSCTNLLTKTKISIIFVLLASYPSVFVPMDPFTPKRNKQINTPFMRFLVYHPQKTGLKPRKKVAPTILRCILTRKLPANFGVGTGRSKTPGALLDDQLVPDSPGWWLKLWPACFYAKKYMPVK